MKTLILSAAAAFGFLIAAPQTEAARISVDLGGGGIRYSDRSHDRDHWRDRDHDRRYYDRNEPSRLVSKSTRTIRESDGDRVIITRRVYEQPDGDRFVRETRERIDR